ncbi:hypothetical protein DXG03_001232 [Asterophora parasitica]|uniref:Uncharacterized protein n=1 Tax=Asterophora parasitica TaxID=117018 RepID=A0A9P7KBX7_9AGAR|nr:hypothetical protein DXG03_001232 [Asterophora parasitica]
MRVLSDAEDGTGVESGEGVRERVVGSSAVVGTGVDGTRGCSFSFSVSFADDVVPQGQYNATPLPPLPLPAFSPFSAPPAPTPPALALTPGGLVLAANPAPSILPIAPLIRIPNPPLLPTPNPTVAGNPPTISIVATSTGVTNGEPESESDAEGEREESVREEEVEGEEVPMTMAGAGAA